MTHPLLISVCSDPPGDIALRATAAQLSAELHLPLLEHQDAGSRDMLLAVTPARCELRVLRGDVAGGRPIFVDLSRVDTTSPAGRSFKQPIIRAIGWRKRAEPAPTIIDATAGFGEDAWLLASFGCRVTAIERHPLLAAMLRDGLRRAAAVSSDAALRFTLVRADARDVLRQLSVTDTSPDATDALQPLERPDVVYLDPMFPLGRKTLERKPMRVVRALVGDDDDAGALLDAALRVATRRVVVKRPSHAAPLGDRKPTTVHAGKAARYDVYAVAALG